jgi:prevent-host-death family protein
MTSVRSERSHAMGKRGPLKSNLTRHVAAVRRGKEIVITSHGHPIARIVPAEKFLVDDLKIIPAKKPVSSLKMIKGMGSSGGLIG